MEICITHGSACTHLDNHLVICEKGSDFAAVVTFCTSVHMLWIFLKVYFFFCDTHPYNILET